MNNLKKEFDDKFGCVEIGGWSVDEKLWSWIESKLKEETDKARKEVEIAYLEGMKKGRERERMGIPKEGVDKVSKENQCRKEQKFIFKLSKEDIKHLKNTGMAHLKKVGIVKIEGK